MKLDFYEERVEVPADVVRALRSARLPRGGIGEVADPSRDVEDWLCNYRCAHPEVGRPRPLLLTDRGAALARRAKRTGARRP